MDIYKKIKLIERNTLEIVKEQELVELLKEKKKPIVYHGFEPSGKVHIGYMIGISKHIDFQKAGLKLILLLADLHAWLNEKGTKEQIKIIGEIYKKSFEAFGVDMEKVKIVLGSSFQLRKEYFEDVLKLSLQTRMLRAKRSMTIIGREEKDPHVAQFVYPLMQVADIKHLGVDIAFGDMAQRKIHMLARETLPKINYKVPIAIHHADMTGLTGDKMSASKPETHIAIDEEPEKIREKILSAFCPKEIHNNPILEICKFIIFNENFNTCPDRLKIRRKKKYGGDIILNSYQELEKIFLEGKLHPLDLKNAVAEHLIKILEPVRKKFKRWDIEKLREKLKW